jgi:hypothetical protein
MTMQGAPNGIMANCTVVTCKYGLCWNVICATELLMSQFV